MKPGCSTITTVPFLSTTISGLHFSHEAVCSVMSGVKTGDCWYDTHNKQYMVLTSRGWEPFRSNAFAHLPSEPRKRNKTMLQAIATVPASMLSDDDTQFICDIAERVLSESLLGFTEERRLASIFEATCNLKSFREGNQ